MSRSVIAVAVLMVLCGGARLDRCQGQPPPAAPAEKESVERVVADGLAAWVKDDRDQLRKCWSAQAPERDKLPKAGNGYLPLPDLAGGPTLRYSRWKVEAGRASVRMRATFPVREARTGRTYKEVLVWDVRLVKEAGGWKWRRVDPSPEPKAFEALAKPQSKEDRARLFVDQHDALTPKIVKLFCELGARYAKQGKDRVAIYYNDLALETARALGDEAELANSLLSRGQILFRFVEYPPALTAYGDALARFRRIGDRVGEAIALNRLGLIHAAYSRHADALRHYEESAAIAEAAKAPFVVTSAWINKGNLYTAMGRYGEALKALAKGRELAAAVEDREEEAGALLGIGMVYSQTGKHAEAVAAYRDCEKIFRGLGRKAELAEVLNNLAVAHHRADRLPEALRAFQEAERLNLEMRRGDALTRTLGNMGLVYLDMGNYGLAQDKLTASLDIWRKLGNRANEAAALNNLGRFYLITGKKDEALKHFRAGLKVAADVGHPEWEFRSYQGLGAVYLGRGDWDEAARHFEGAIGRIELLRRRAYEPSLQTSLFQQHTQPYYALAYCQFKSAAFAEAFATGEQAKARTLVEMLEDSRVPVDRALAEGERQRERGLRDKLAESEGQFWAAHSTDAKMQARAALAGGRKALEDYQRELFFKHADLKDQRARFQPATLDELNAGLFDRAPGLALLSYFVGSERTLLFVLDRDPENRRPRLAVHALALAGAALRKQVEQFHHRCSGPGQEYEAAAAELYQALLAPAEADLRAKTHLAIVPDGDLHGLPFQALRDARGRHLIERFSVSYAPSATALLKMAALARRRDREGPAALPMLALGRPPALPPAFGDLEHSEEEARGVARLFKTEALLGTAASTTRAKASFPEARYVHLAAHGVCDRAAPLYSYVVLARDAREGEFLYAHELMQMTLRARLVVLSACHTAEGQPVPGEGLLGLSWALFVARAPSCLLTQWEVNDRSTALLMQEFYTRLGPSGPTGVGRITKAAALRQAQLALLARPATRHPYHWAPFVLVGDWGK